MLWTIILIILIFALLGGGPWGPMGYGYGYGHVGLGLPGILVIILIVLLVTGRL